MPHPGVDFDFDFLLTLTFDFSRSFRSRARFCRFGFDFCPFLGYQLPTQYKCKTYKYNVFLGIGSGGSPKRQYTILGDRPVQTRFERLSKQSNDPPLSRVLALENIKTAQDLEITNLKKRVKKLEKKKKSITPQLKRRLFKVRIKSSAEKSLEDAETQG
ncbi:hypothetical protein Tco_0182516, partial [Tanacetum coccineum]